MKNYGFNFDVVDNSWKHCLQEALKKVDAEYLQRLTSAQDWLPGPQKIFNAFSLPVDQVNYVLLGESPYPRAHSANGYAFWDAAVKEIWSENGLSKPVNRATSLRNIIKMLLLAEDMLDSKHLSQTAIAKLNKRMLIHTNEELFENFLDHGFLLLNATLVLHKGTTQKHKDARAWTPFLHQLLHHLLQKRPQVKLLLLGCIAKTIDKTLGDLPIKKVCIEHPYNHSFIVNEKAIAFFRPLHLLRK